MFRNLLVVAVRNLKRQPGYSLINVSGLAAGIAAFVLISGYIRTELSFDRHIPHGDDVYRVILDAQVGEQEILTSSSPAVMAGAFLDAFPEVVNAVRLDAFTSDLLITVDERAFYEEGFFMADSTVFDVFAIPLIEGDPATALNRPLTIALSESVARRYFGDESPLGRSVRVDGGRAYEVTAVMADPPEHAHFRPRILASFLSTSQWNDTVWLNNSFFTYIRLAPDSDPSVLASKFPDFLRIHVGPQIEQFTGQPYDAALASGMRYDWVLERLPDIYLHTQADDQLGATGDIRYLYILGIIAGFVLLIACINFMNLSTARATGRAREVGVRKVMGSDRAQLVRQFLGESVFLAVMGMVVAIGLIAAALPAFSALSGTSLVIGSGLILVTLGTAVVTGLLAGVYPALVLSGFNPVTVLKGSFSTSRRGTNLRSALVVFQFAITIVLLVGTAVVFKQLRFIQATETGFDAEQVVVVPLETAAGRAGFDTFRSDLMQHAAIHQVAASGVMPGPDRIHNNTGFRGEGMREDDFFVAGLGEVSDDYVETLGLEMVAGRDFDPAFSDSLSWVINEAAAARMGFSPKEAVGKTLARLNDGDSRVGTVIGVAADAHFASLHDQVQPLVFGNWGINLRYLPVRVDRARVPEALALVEERWTTLEPGFPFRYYFLDSDYQRFYERESRLGALYLYFTLLAVFIACLGLFGLASYVTTQRTREIGVRKALGASVGSVIALLTREFTLLVLIACVLAFPVAWFAMSRWLEDFAYATSMGVAVFLGAGGAAVGIAWLTVAWQSFRTALTNPVRALRHE